MTSTVNIKASRAINLFGKNIEYSLLNTEIALRALVKCTDKSESKLEIYHIILHNCIFCYNLSVYHKLMDY